MKKVKSAISHTLLEKSDVKTAIANANNIKRPNGQGSPAELFFKRDTRLPGLATIPQRKDDFSSEIQSRCKAREKQTQQTEKLRALPQFAPGERVAVRNTDVCR